MFSKQLFNMMIVSSKFPHFRNTISLSRFKHTNLSYSIIDANCKNKPEIAKDKAPLVVLHGLFGNKKNFESLSKSFSQKTGIQVITVDLRNHGSSDHSDDMEYESMCEDVENLLKNQLGVNQAIVLGHSMGGKVAITMSLTKPDLVKGLIVVDIAPTDTSSTSFALDTDILDAMANLNFNGMSYYQAKKYAFEIMSTVEENKRIVDFLLTNLIEENGNIKWRINIPVIKKNIHTVLSFPSSLLDKKYTGPCIFIGGANSTYIVPERDEANLKKFFPNHTLTMIPNASHWVHADDPVTFGEKVVNFIKPLQQTTLFPSC